MTAAEKRRMILTCLSGNVLEWFDFAVYGFVAHIIAKQFFPSDNHLLSIILTYSVFAVGFFARPLGSIVFGHIGDTMGRRKALILSNFVMAVPTVCIGLLPTYEMIGVWAPILLMICRIFQGASIGGEFTGSFVYLVEQAPEGKKGSMGRWADIGCHMGMMTGGLTVAVLSQHMDPDNFASYGWRIPFVCGVFLAVLGVYMRRKLPESQEVVKPVKTPVKTLFKDYGNRVVFASLMMTITSIGYYMICVFIPNQTIFLGKFSPHKAFYLNTAVLLFLMLGNMISGKLADTYNKVKLYQFGAIIAGLVAFPMFYALDNFSIVSQFIFMAIFAFSLGFIFGPRPPLLVEMFPPSVRFTGVALTMSVANGFLGGATPLVSTWLSSVYGNMWPCAIVFTACGATYFALNRIAKLPPLKKDNNLKEVA